MSDDELVEEWERARVSSNPTEYILVGDILAARIRELITERDEAVTQMVEAKVEWDRLTARIRELESQIKSDAMQYLADVQRLEDSISELETKLAKAIAALRITDKWLRELDLYANPDYHLAPELKSVRDTLAELTGTDQ